MEEIRLTVNGREVQLGVEPDLTLLTMLRERLGLTGTKVGCGVGECGACTVLLDGRPVTSCLVLAVEADGCTVETIEGEGVDGLLTDLQQAFIEEDAIQCGFCTPGMIMAARALLDRTPQPTEDEMLEAMAGNLCRCTGYAPILEAIRKTAATRANRGGDGAHRCQCGQDAGATDGP